jgi:hypothetical protein
MVQRFVGALIVASGTQCSNYDTKKGRHDNGAPITALC